MDGVEVMREISKLDDKLSAKIDKVNDNVNTLITEIKVNNQKNDDAHYSFDSRIKCLESEQTISNKMWYDFLNSPLLIKAVIIIVLILVTGGSALTVTQWLGLL